MKINYDEAMNHLQTMFSGIDREVIHNILAMHKGKLDPTIQDLLKLCDDTVEEENVFQGEQPVSNFADSAGVLGGEISKQRQEEKDLELALKLQEKYYKESELASQQQRQQYQPYVGADVNPYEGYSHQAVGKKKKHFSDRLKDAKVKFLNLFRKGKKKGSEVLGIDKGYEELGDINELPPDLTANMQKYKINDELEDVPDLGSNPYTKKSYNEPIRAEDVDVDSRGINEEAKANFNLAQHQTTYNKAGFQDQQQQDQKLYPTFYDKKHEPSVNEYFSDKKHDKGGDFA